MNELNKLMVRFSKLKAENERLKAQLDTLATTSKSIIAGLERDLKAERCHEYAKELKLAEERIAELQADLDAAQDIHAKLHVELSTCSGCDDRSHEFWEQTLIRFCYE